MSKHAEQEESAGQATGNQEEPSEKPLAYPGQAAQDRCNFWHEERAPRNKSWGQTGTQNPSPSPSTVVLP